MSVNLTLIQKPCDNLQNVDVHTFPLSDSVFLRVYASTEPRNLKIAELQKGLIMGIDRTEAVGEGTGFGLPVLIYSDETYFSGSSRLYASYRDGCPSVVKEFAMDRVARNNFRNVTLENRAARSFIEWLSDLYQAHPRLRPLILKGLTGRINIGKVFLKVPSKGIITVIYSFGKSGITVKADFKKLEKSGLRKIFMLNEQGTEFFRRYTDSLGTELLDDKIGAWDQTGGEWACLQTLDGEIGFRLWRVKNGVLRRGREFLEGSLDWVGLDYEIRGKTDVFQYVIDVLGSEAP